MSEDLAAWLNGVLDELQEVAEREQHVERQPLGWNRTAAEADSMLVSLFSPAVVLADIAAKRQIVERHQQAKGPTAWPGCNVCVEFAQFDEIVWEKWPCPTLRALASAYRHRPGWRTEWGPES